MKKFVLYLSLMLTGVCMFASCNLISSAGFNNKGLPTPGQSKNEQSSSAVKIDHSVWNELLKKHVGEDGMVDYNGLKKDRARLDIYLKNLSRQNPDESWGRDELLAYYINLYNAYTVDLILRNYPLKSIKDISGAWTKEFITIGDIKISLGGIENSLLRKMDEPRIHFAINCASISCPKLLNEAFVASRLEQQLEMVTRDFINSDKNEIREDKVILSRIFDWYKNDFTGDGDLLDYINKYSALRINDSAGISYKEYNWNLNDAN